METVIANNYTGDTLGRISHGSSPRPRADANRVTDTSHHNNEGVSNPCPSWAVLSIQNIHIT